MEIEKQIKLTTEQAQELYKINPEYRNNILSVFTDEELGIADWDTVTKDDIWMTYINSKDEITSRTTYTPSIYLSKNKKESIKNFEKWKLMVEMQRFADFYNEDWVPKWNNDYNVYGIVIKSGIPRADYFHNSNYFVFGIVLKTAQLCRKMLEIFKERIIKYY